MNQWGMHGPNEGFRNLEAFFTLGVDNYTGLEISFDRTYEESPDRHTIGRELRNRCPDARILVRFYGWTAGGGIVLSNWSEVYPIAWARQCAAWANSHRWLTNRFTLANEMNLPAEGGGWTKEWYGAINDWLVLAITEFRRLCPWAIIHWPALASGHSEDQDDNGDGTIGYEICAPSIRLCDVVDHHDYWVASIQLHDPELAEWYALRFRRARAVLLELGIDKPMFISECGWYGRMEDAVHNAGAELVWFFEQLYNYPYVLGATPFIWDSDDAHQGQRIGRCEASWWPIQSAEKRDMNEPKLPDWIIDLRPEAVEHTGKTITRHIGTLVHHTGNPDAPLQNQIDYVKQHPCYHFLIDPQGTIYYMRDISEVVWHAGDGPDGVWNGGGIAATFIGSFIGYAPSDHAFASFRRLRQWLIDMMGVPPYLKGHKEIRLTTACPGNWYPDLQYKLLPDGEESKLDTLRKENTRLRQLVERRAEEILELNGVIDEVIRVAQSKR